MDRFRRGAGRVIARGGSKTQNNTTRPRRNARGGPRLTAEGGGLSRFGRPSPCGRFGGISDPGFGGFHSAIIAKGPAGVGPEIALSRKRLPLSDEPNDGG